MYLNNYENKVLENVRNASVIIQIFSKLAEPMLDMYSKKQYGMPYANLSPDKRKSAIHDLANTLPDNTNQEMVGFGEYFINNYRGHFYAKAQNLIRVLAPANDAAVSRFDLLLLPTLPMKATPLPPANASLKLYVQRALEMLGNTCPLDVTGHPAMSVPCGMSNGLPIGMQLIGKHWDESTIYRAAHAFEQLGDWRNF
jgi:amidase